MRRNKIQGFTLIEVLVAGTVSLLLAVTIFSVFVQSRRTLSHAIGTAEMVQATRIPLDRITAYLGAGSTVRSEDIFLFPPSGASGTNERGQTVDPDDPDTWYRYFILRTTEDFLSPTYDPDEIWTLRSTLPGANHAALMDAYENDAQRVYDYIVWFEDDTNGISVLPNEDKVLAIARITQLSQPGPGVGGVTTLFRDSAWAAGNPWADLEPAYQPRIISRRLEDMSFKRESSALDVNVLATAQVRSAAAGNVTKRYRATQRIPIASEIMQ